MAQFLGVPDDGILMVGGDGNFEMEPTVNGNGEDCKYNNQSEGCCVSEQRDVGVPVVCVVVRMCVCAVHGCRYMSGRVYGLCDQKGL